MIKQIPGQYTPRITVAVPTERENAAVPLARPENKQPGFIIFLYLYRLNTGSDTRKVPLTCSLES